MKIKQTKRRWLDYAKEKSKNPCKYKNMYRMWQGKATVTILYY
nr:MAG TPA_asm: hypothetical protein [Caudoviricetes sp.]